MKSANILRRQAKQARSRETVDAILAAAVQVLVARGYGQSNTDRIAQRAGVSVGTLYQYFGSKDDVYDAVLTRDAKLLLHSLRVPLLDPSQPLEASLQAIFTGLLEALPHIPELLRELRYAPNALLQRRLDGLEQQLRAFVRDLLEAYRPQLKVDELDLAAFMIVHASAAVGAKAGVDFSPERLATELSKLFSRYLVRG